MYTNRFYCKRLSQPTNNQTQSEACRRPLGHAVTLQVTGSSPAAVLG